MPEEFAIEGAGSSICKGVICVEVLSVVLYFLKLHLCFCDILLRFAFWLCGWFMCRLGLLWVLVRVGGGSLFWIMWVFILLTGGVYHEF